jgi:hypothetical protein
MGRLDHYFRILKVVKNGQMTEASCCAEENPQDEEISVFGEAATDVTAGPYLTCLNE